MKCDNCGSEIRIRRIRKLERQEFDETGIVAGVLRTEDTLYCDCVEARIQGSGEALFNYPETWGEGKIAEKTL